MMEEIPITACWSVAQMKYSSSSWLFFFSSFVIGGRRMKTFSTVAARMLPADDKRYAAVDPEDADEWCMYPLPAPSLPSSPPLSLIST